MLSSLKLKIASEWKRLQRAKLWQNISKGQIKLFTYLIVGLILLVTILELTLLELDKRQASTIDRERNAFIQRHSASKINSNVKYNASRALNGKTNRNDGDDFFKFKYNFIANDIRNVNNKSGTVKRHVGQDGETNNDATDSSQDIHSSSNMDPFEVSESQFVVYRERHTMGNVNDSIAHSFPAGEHLEAAAAAATETSYITSSDSTLASTDLSNPIAVSRIVKTGNKHHVVGKTGQPDIHKQTSGLATEQTTNTTPTENLVDAARVGAIAGALIGDHFLSQFEHKDDEPTATGTNTHQWAGRPVDPQPESEAELDETGAENENSVDISPSYTSKLERSAKDIATRNGGNTASLDSMPDSIESLMGSDDREDLDEQQSNEPQTTNLMQARSNQLPSRDRSIVYDESEPIEDSDDADDADNRPTRSLAPSDPMRTHSSYDANALQQTNQFLFPQTNQDLNTAAGHHYGKKKKKIIIKKKKKMKVYKKKKIKKVKKIKVIKKKKKKKIKKHKKKKHHEPDHGKYYM